MNQSTLKQDFNGSRLARAECEAQHGRHTAFHIGPKVWAPGDSLFVFMQREDFELEARRHTANLREAGTAE